MTALHFYFAGFMAVFRWTQMRLLLKCSNGIPFRIILCIIHIFELEGLKYSEYTDWRVHYCNMQATSVLQTCSLCHYPFMRLCIFHFFLVVSAPVYFYAFPASWHLLKNKKNRSSSWIHILTLTLTFTEIR